MNNIPKKRVYGKRPIYRLSKLNIPQYQTLLETYPDHSARFRELICPICHNPFYLNSHHKFNANQTFCSYKCRYATKRKESINAEYFSNLTHTTANHLGYIFSICSIEFNTAFDYIHLYSSNKNTLEYAQSFLSNDSPVKVYKDSYSTERGWHIIIKSKYLQRDLMEYGLGVGDMYLQGIPNIPSDFYSDFIQGFLNGTDTIEVCDENGILAYKRHLILSGEIFQWVRDSLTDGLGIDQETDMNVWEDYIDGRFWLCVGKRVRIVKKRGYLEEYYDLPDGWDL